MTALPPLQYVPPRSELRIGVIGAGGIVKDAHLPAYRKAGYQVTAICDVREETARALGRQFEIPAVVADPAALIARDDVDVVDLAIPESSRPAVVEAVLRARKPLLIQKPLAYSLARARDLVRRFEAARVPLAVNQNARFAPEFFAARRLVGSGLLGEVFDLRWTMRYTADWRPWARDSWYAKEDRFQVLSWSIHHLDLFRYLLADEAQSVYCTLQRRPGQNMRGDIMAAAILRFRKGAQATMVDSNAVVPGRPHVQELDVDGSQGSIHLRVSEPRCFAFYLAQEMPGDGEDAPAHQPVLEGAWYPDGFAGSMGDFLEAIACGREPTVSGRSNLGTIALVEACYESARTGRPVDLPLQR